ncbi:MAG: 2-amino-4-hydroxy-6-hydroxymethyldihydropteridine diphosphokinase [Firmicutes bacterium]|nr:2-amino-4-hydroxy-6-hydroxymethyldihydropteridine diphosphokinase [Bacillota bacterium]MDD4793148.1 2-amino-4-hydroxy-6-hydroxymethyldihydropteridine diphosphokinase [Bacillota bacterium]
MTCSLSQGQSNRDAMPAYFGLGSNLGDRLENLSRAAAMLAQAHGLSDFEASRVYETEPWGFADQPPFLNCVIRAFAILEPAEILRLARSVEDVLGRERSVRWGPRIIDVDILMVDGLTVETEELVIPHPRMWERAFVLIPLMDLAPDMITPGGASLAQRIESLGSTDGVRLFDGDLQGVFGGEQNTLV